VAKLNDALNRKGFKWDYKVSDITSNENPDRRERYAFLWKTSKVKMIGKAWLEVKYNVEIDREPFFATFLYNNTEFTLVNFHAIPKAKQPETEIKYFKFFPAEYPGKNLIFCGDYNCPQSHTVFNPLKSLGYKPILTNQKTSLKQECVTNNCLASEYDNMFYNASKVKYNLSGIVPFFINFNYDLKAARKVSDHVPIFFEFSLN
jgi:deoxyribonuclease-1-like protein